MKHAIDTDTLGRKWGYLLLTPKELATVKAQYEPALWTKMVWDAQITANESAVPPTYEVVAREDRVFICVEHHHDERIDDTFRKLEKYLNA